MAKTLEEQNARLQRKAAHVAQHLGDVVAAQARVKFELRKVTDLLVWIYKTEAGIDEIRETILRVIPRHLKQKGLVGDLALRELGLAPASGGVRVPAWAEYQGYGIYPCDSDWHRQTQPRGAHCLLCRSEWWAADGTECPEMDALILEIDTLRAVVTL